jgi:hypothetical protein
MYAEDNPLRFWDPDGYRSQGFIDIFRRDEADREAEYHDLVKTKGPDAPITKRALAELNQVRATIAELEQGKDFEDNVVTPVVQEVDMMIATAPVAVAGATVKAGRYVIFGLSVAGGVSGTNKVIEGVEEGDPWKGSGRLPKCLSGIGAKKTGEEVIEDAGVFVKKQGSSSRAVTRAVLPLLLLVAPGRGHAPVPTVTPSCAGGDAAKPMQMAASTKGSATARRQGPPRQHRPGGGADEETEVQRTPEESAAAKCNGGDRRKEPARCFWYQPEDGYAHQCRVRHRPGGQQGASEGRPEQ